MSKPKQAERREYWRQRIAQQEKSGQSIRAFCREQGLQEHSFYMWRKQLSSSSNKAVRFALVETEPKHNGEQHPTRLAAPSLELILATGDRLQIPADAATLRLVLSVLNQHP